MPYEEAIEVAGLERVERVKRVEGSDQRRETLIGKREDRRGGTLLEEAKRTWERITRRRRKRDRVSCLVAIKEE